MKNILAFLLAATFTSSVQAQVTILPPDAIVDGRTIGEWTVEWWNWVYAQPTNQSPLIDNDGSHAAAGQPAGNVFLLGNTARPGQVTRQITVQEGKYLFFPVRYVSLDNVDFPVPLSAEELRDSAAGVVALMANLHVVIDGTSIDVLPHRVTSPVFSYDFPTTDNVESFVSGQPVQGLVDPIVSDGYWIMLEPLAVGTHTINFGGDIGPPFNSSKDVTAIITVVPIRLTDQIAEIVSLIEGSSLTEKSKRALLEELSQAAKHFSRDHLRPGIDHLRDFQKKVWREVPRTDPALASLLIEAAQSIVDRAIAQLDDPPKH